MESFSYKKVLIVNTFGIGDVLFTTPLIANLKQHDPDITLGYIANQRTADILKRHELIDQVFVYERDEFHDCYKQSKVDFLKKSRSFLDEIKSYHYDVVIDLSMNTPTGFLMKMAGISERVGFDYKGRGKFLTTKIPFKGYEGKHVVEFYLDLLRFLGIDAKPKEMSFPLSNEDQQWVDGMLDELKCRDIIVVVPGGGASWGKDAYRKQWPAVKFAALIDQISIDCNAKIILVGGPSDRALNSEILNLLITSSALDFTDELTLAQSAALFAKSRLVIANDGGPLHMAVAVGGKTVSIFGPVDDNVYGPYPKEGHRVVSSDIACRPCYRRFRVAECGHISCLRDLGVEEVFEKVKEIL